MMTSTRTRTRGSTVATGFGLARECGLTDTDVTPDEEEPAVTITV